MRTLGIGLRMERHTQTGEESSLGKFNWKNRKNLPEYCFISGRLLLLQRDERFIEIETANRNNQNTHKY